MEYPTLLERAKPELKKAIATFKVDYPNSAERVEWHLEREIGVSFLQYGIICEIRSILRRANLKFDLNDPWEWFLDRP